MSTVPRVLPNLYQSPSKFWTFIFPNGTKVLFSNGRCMTSDPYQIEQLNKEVSLGHPMIFIDPNEVTVSEEHYDPLIGLRRRIAAEERDRLLAEMEVAVNSNRDFGTSIPTPLTPANTTTIAAITANGDASARFQNLRNRAVNPPGKVLETVNLSAPNEMANLLQPNKSEKPL